MDLNVLIVGGGIHGVGLLHDLASRQIRGVHLVEKSVLAAGSSSRSTKLVHGGLRYLERLSEWPLVHEALKERSLLLRVLEGMVQPLPFVLPNYKGQRPTWMLRTGLFLYDMLAGDGGLPAAERLTAERMFEVAPYLKRSRIENDIVSSFLYYDAQMLDDAIVRVAAFAARKLGASFDEHTTAESVTPLPSGGYRVLLKTQRAGLDVPEMREVTTKVIINAAGAECNANLLRWGFLPEVVSLLNLGSHLVYKAAAVRGHKPSECAATLLQVKDGRIVFFIPWNGRWLFGTTESALVGEPRGLKVPDEDVRYLSSIADEYLDLDDPRGNLDEVFSGVRTMPLEMAVPRATSQAVDAWRADPFRSPYYVADLFGAPVAHQGGNVTGGGTNPLPAEPAGKPSKGRNALAKLSRETVITETPAGVFSIYGGKYTTYRSQALKLGTRVAHAIGQGGKSQTHAREYWFLDDLMREHPEIFTTSASVRRL